MCPVRNDIGFNDKTGKIEIFEYYSPDNLNYEMKVLGEVRPARIKQIQEAMDRYEQGK